MPTSDTGHSPCADPRKPLVLTRPYNGIGDWLFALACLKYVARQRPDVPIFVDFTMPRAGLRLPEIVPQAFRASDVPYTSGWPAGDETPLVTRDSLVYRKWPPDLYLESMVHHLNDQTGLGIEYEHGIYPDLGGRWVEGTDRIVMIGHGKRRERHRKEWGFSNLSRLAELLKVRGYRITQIGASHDAKIPSADRHVMGATFDQVRNELLSCRAYVGLENGIMVMAAYLGVPQCTIYDGQVRPSNPCRVDFERHYKIPDRIEPPVADRQIARWLDAS